LKPDEKTKAVRDAYAAHIERMFVLWGEKPEAAKKASETVMALESRLATASQTRVERRDPQKLYNRIDRKGLKEKAPAFAWDPYFAALGAKDLQAVNVNSVGYFEELGKLAKENKAAELKTYFTWVVMRWAVPMLPKAFADEQFTYLSKALTGAKEDRPRWKKCVAWTDSDLGEALGREFVRRHFGEDSKKLTNAMVLELQKAFEKNLSTLEWMDAPTRAAALIKVQRMAGNNKIGYPDTWRDYSTVTTARTSFLANQLSANRYAVKRELNKIGKPPDRNEWWMSPPTVNAYNEPQKNEIVFPAGILQPPFFDRNATDAVNFGAMGMVVGHEITHGFDDEGRQYDVDGNLKNWWSEATGKTFDQKVACVKEQFDGYTAIEDVKLDGKLTLGENVADLGGLKLAHSAMSDWYQAKGTSPDHRYTPPQQFFLGYAQAWCTKMRPETARMRAATDSHAPPYWRVNGPLANLASFQEAFQCQANAAMVKPKRCDVW
jgi:endothelin-converting enzyme/putative endopeptidase